MSVWNSSRLRGFRALWDSGEGLALILSLAFCVITAILMAPILPCEESFGYVGVLFIYSTVFVLMSGIFRMIITRAKKWSGGQEAT